VSLAARQTKALLVDAYRELNAKKLFWITLILSSVLVIVFAGVDLKQGSLWFFGFSFDLPLPFERDLLFKIMFTQFGIGVWLTWVATVLALISTAGIVPDMLASGSVELLVGKPIGRIRLLLTKYVLGLLFVALQVAVFSVGSFLVFGIKGVMWEPRILLAVPIVLVFYSYLFSICVLFGLLTRSTIAALLLTLLSWFMLFVVHATDSSLVFFRSQVEVQVESRTERLERFEAFTRQSIERTEGEDAAANATADDLDRYNPIVASERRQVSEQEAQLESVSKWADRVRVAKTVLPKTSETIGLLERFMLDEDDFAQLRDEGNGGSFLIEEDDPDTEVDESLRMSNSDVTARTEDEMRERSIAWIMGTSLVFEAVILALCCWLFRRRDF
jgi:ABC-type transport system involved in multi-copper enzyme maturation permease subunit